ncbi:SDR family NAD(P)-dependent oxidoreductase [Streptomyces sp. LN245]|uniref:SDR family NAD(P)-dependent oxidoreductase n=1 Tax=Streptomyces sp. LN245 TaxID=3112975 RepID=UPI003711C98E
MASTPRRSDLAGLSVLVTGGSRGLGLLLSARLAQRGCLVTMAARDEDELRRGAEWAEERTGKKFSIAVCDVRDRHAVESVVRQADARHGGLDIVVANAGVIQVAPVASLGSGAFEDAMDTIFGGAVNTAMAALPFLRASEAGGRLCLIGSVGGLLAVPHLLPYSCAKAAVGALGEGLRAETTGDRLSVTTVHPGLMRTGSHLQAEFGGRSSREFAWFSALSGTPVLSMDADRAAERIVRALERRRTRLVLTPAARAASVAHGVALPLSPGSAASPRGCCPLPRQRTAAPTRRGTASSRATASIGRPPPGRRRYAGWAAASTTGPPTATTSTSRARRPAPDRRGSRDPRQKELSCVHWPGTARGTSVWRPCRTRGSRKPTM